MPEAELLHLERLAEALRTAVAAADWARAAGVDEQLHQALRAALSPDGPAAGAPAATATLGRIMQVYQAAMQDAVRARDAVQRELSGLRAGHRAAAGYLSTAQS